MALSLAAGDGIRTIMDRDGLIDALTRAAAQDERVEALLLIGSLGAGQGDVWSDVDTVLVTTPESHADVVASAREWVAAIAPPALWRQLFPPHPLFHAVLPGWLRLDVTITVPGHIPTVRAASRPLYDPSGLHDRLEAQRPARKPDPGKIEQTIEEFLRVMGLAPVALGRGDLLCAARGWDLLRGLFLDLLVEAQAPPLPPGALATTRLLPGADVDLLLSLPIPNYNRDSIIVSQTAIAEAFLTRARSLAVAIGVIWPAPLEAEMRARLRLELGVDLRA